MTSHGPGHDGGHGKDCDIDCGRLRRQLAELEGDPEAAGRCAELRGMLERCPECADTLRADELFRLMLSRRCGERAPEQLRERVTAWFRETCHAQTTVELRQDGTRIVRHQEIRHTRYGQ